MKLNQFFALNICVISLIGLTLFGSCTDPKGHKDYILSADELSFKGGFPDTAINLSIVNSDFDDYNSAMTGDGEKNGLIFSSNRNSNGADFDLIKYNTFWIYYDFETETVAISSSAKSRMGLSIPSADMLNKINSDNDELGPYFHPLSRRQYNDDKEFLLFYAQESDSNLDLKFMEQRLYSPDNGQTRYFKNYGPYEASALNTSEFDEAYISIDGSKLYYCSNRLENFNIYSSEIDTTVDMVKFLTADSLIVSELVNNVNSTAHDKCPYIINDLMVFVSDREGGYGGYDLWYSQLNDSIWSNPVNFGPRVNSEYDEYRPIVKNYGHVSRLPNDMMIFSSNRPGGMGGFDLYAVGIDLLRE